MQDLLVLSEHADDSLAESFTLGAEEGNEEMETTEGQNGDHEVQEGEEEAAEVSVNSFFCLHNITDLSDIKIEHIQMGENLF